MLNITICYQNEKEMRYLAEEITKCFSAKGIFSHIQYCETIDILLEITQKNGCPDIIIFDLKAALYHKIQKAALLLKKKKRSLVFLMFGRQECFHHDELALLQPAYHISGFRNKKLLWNHLRTAYEISIADNTSFAYYKRPEYSKIALRDILYFASEGRKVNLIAKNLEDSFYHKLDDIETILAAKNCRFLRIHKSYLVNTRYIVNYDRKNIELINGERLIISEYNRKETNYMLKSFFACPAFS